MGAFARWMHGREYIKLLLHWRWLVLVVAMPISLVIEFIEEQAANLDLDLLDEVLIDGIVLPIATWIVLTFAARKMAAQFEREAVLERRQQLSRQLAEHREYYDLARFLVRLPSSLLSVEQVILHVYDPKQRVLSQVTAWSAPGFIPGDQPQHFMVLIHNNAQVGVLELTFPDGRQPLPKQLEQLYSFAPEMATALTHAIADHRQAEQVFREARAYERRRLTQELHDSLAQQVFYLNLGLDQLADDGSLAKNEAIQRKLASMRDVATDVYDQIRHNLSILRAWEQVNLTEAVSDLAHQNAHNADMTVAINVQGEPAWLSPHACEQLYGIVREGLNNIVKHAQARHVQLELAWQPEALVIRLVDDGVGFDPRRPVEEGHYGLTLMRETVEAMRGELSIASAPGRGSRLTVSVPLGVADRTPRPLADQPLESVPNPAL